MITIRYSDYTLSCDHAAKSEHDVWAYDENNKILLHISNIWDSEWNYISIEGGDWLDPEDIPSYEDTIQANLDFLSMINESLESENEALRADVDFLLMIMEG